MLLGCGSSLIALTQQPQDPNQIGLVLVSHLHGDHFGGLSFMVLDGQFAHRTRPLHLVGPAGVGEQVQAVRCGLELVDRIPRVALPRPGLACTAARWSSRTATTSAAR